MLVLWPDAADNFRDLLRQRGLDPNQVASPASAWRAFWSFLAVEIDGLDAKQARNADGFAVSWGRHSWSDDLPTLSFNRYLRVNGDQPERWRLRLDMVFRDLPALADIAELNTQSSGMYYERSVSAREVLWEVEHYPALRALWTSTPLRSAIAFGPQHPRVGDVEAFDARQQAAYLEWRARYG